MTRKGKRPLIEDMFAELDERETVEIRTFGTMLHMRDVHPQPLNTFSQRLANIYILHLVLPKYASEQLTLQWRSY